MRTTSAEVPNDCETTDITAQPISDQHDTGPADAAEGALDAVAPSTVKPGRGPRSISLTVRSLTVIGVGMALVAATIVVGWLYLDARSQLDAQAAQSADNSRAEKIALDYAVNAATMDSKDLQAWRLKLVAGTSPELNKKLSDAATSMEQILVPLQWSSSARPLVAKVRSTTGGIYVVDSFVSVDTKTIQSPDPLQSTATYSTTIDSNNNWQITDVGGISSALQPN
jgi:Mce-associated membrane protein